jgi:uncharacterized membrane protein
MSQYRWIDQSHPQTLQIACFLLYLNAVFALLRGGLGILLILGAVAAFFIANEKKWAYYLGVGIALFSFVVIAKFWIDVGFDLQLAISVIFDGALVALLLHRDSRNHQRIWFK